MEDQLGLYTCKIREHHPDLNIVSARLNREGLVNDVVIINDILAFRFPKTVDAWTIQGYEIDVLAIVQQHVSVPVPFVEERTDHFVRYRYLPGKPIYRHELLRLDDQHQDQIAADLGIFSQQLHTIPLESLPQAPWDSPASDSQQRMFLRQFETIKAELYPLLWTDQRAWIEDLFAPLQNNMINLDAFTPMLIHDDLAPYHLLHDPASGRLTGVLDFGTARIGDPAKDIALLLLAFGEGFLHRIAHSYAITQPIIDRARFFSNMLELEWALKGIQTGDQTWLLVHLGRARDVSPIGTTWKA